MRWLFVPLLALLYAAPARAEHPSLVGAWRFVSEVDRRADGTEIDVVPRDGYVGLIVYTQDGFMSGQMFPRGRTWKPATATLDDLRRTIDLSTSYFGRYEVDRAAGTVTHKVQGNLDPTGETEAYVRQFKLSGNQLILSGTWEYGGEKLGFEIVWQRAR